MSEEAFDYDYWCREKGAKTGPKPVVTEAVLEKLEYSYSFGCTNSEAAAYAGISESALTVYLRNNPKFKKHRDLLKKTPKIRAKEGLFKNLTEKNPKLCLDVLERVSPEEFSKQSHLLIDQKTTVMHLTDTQLIDDIRELNKKLGLDIVEGEIVDDVKELEE